MLITILLLIITLILFIFSSKTLSPIPYFPSQPVDLPLIIKALNLKNNQTVFDLGAGDGIVIFNAAQQAYKQKLDTKFVAIEINPVLILILYLRRFFHPNKKNIFIIQEDIFKIDIKNQIAKIKMTDKKLKISNNVTMKQFNNITIYLYISPWYLENVIENCKLKIENFDVVSYMYPIKSLKRNEKIIQGKNKIFIYH